MADDDDPEVLDLGLVDVPDTEGDPKRPGDARPDLSRRRALALGGLLAVAGGLVVVQSRGSSTARGPFPAASVPAPVRRRGRRAAPPLVSVTDLGHPLLGGPHWDLFGLGDSMVVRVELSTGRVTETALGPMANVELSLVPMRGGVFVHRADYGPGYAVTDGRPATLMPPTLDGPGPMLPGPDLDHVWVQVGTDDPARMVLATGDGRLTRTSVPVPTYPTFEAMPDGAGYPLFGAVGGFYRGVPGGSQRVTDGVVVAAGPQGWLAVECDDRDRCAAVLVDHRGRRREVPGVADPRLPAGVLAPNGRAAAVYVVGMSAATTLTLLDLVSGGRRTVGMTVGGGQGVSCLAWSPDSRWLFAVDASARVLVVDARTGRATPLVAGLPNVLQIAVRPA
jgi:hypothetical protein